MKNNLFNYATGELSQDAFLCWLFSHAIKDGNNNDLRKCAIAFIQEFIPSLKDTDDIYLSCEPQRQYKHIDILLTVNDKYKVIIEDKTYTSEHSDQLRTYKEEINKEFPDYTLVCVYYKIWLQSNTKQIVQNEYLFFGLESILKVLDRFKYIQNDIFTDYYEYLKNLDDEINAFETKPVSDWNWAQINGFYNYIKEELRDCGMQFDFGYVANQNGGFYGMWIYNNTIKVFAGEKFELYLQCEFVNQSLKICYKISSQDNTKVNKTVREHFVWEYKNQKWIDKAAEYNFTKPGRYGCGRTATVGIYKDYETIETYSQARQMIKEAIEEFNNMVIEIK